MIRTRKEPEANYSSVFVDGETLRIPLNPQCPITELRYPEFYDISPGNKCSGNCQGQLIKGTPTTACYAAASKTGVHYTNLAEKVNKFFDTMDSNQLPIQVAIGGEQEPLENPEIWEMIETFNKLQIVANYTTNGMFTNDFHIEKTKKLCGGVAITLHPHLEKFWRRAINRYFEAGIRLNVHVIISDKASIDNTAKYYKEFADSKMVDYFVLLPWMSYGHAKGMNQTIDYPYLKAWIDKIYKDGKIAFGANFYNFLRKQGAAYDVSLYPPEILSKYCRLNDEMFLPDGKVQIYNNSFDKSPVIYTPGIGCELGKARTEFLEVTYD